MAEARRKRLARRRLGPSIEGLEERTLFAFGLTTFSGSYVVDTGAGVVFSVLRTGTSSTVHSGDLNSFKLNGNEFAAPFASPGPQRYSHFESGMSNPIATATPPFPGAQVTATVDPSPTPQWIKIACDDTRATVGTSTVTDSMGVTTSVTGTGVIQYYIAHRNDPAIYMATYAPELLVSSTRFITYLNWSKFPNHPNPADTSALHGTAQTTIESGDVFKDPVDGYTHSKYYQENRLIGHVYHGATGAGTGAFMFIGSRESGSGGPFWKDIDFQSTGAAVEMYNIPYSDHSQSEPFRPGLHGPYALVLTNGSAPATPNYSFLDGVGLTGLVPASGRGALMGTATGIAPGRVPTIGLKNSTAQYWGTPDASGNYTITGIKPGTYTETLFDEELEVGTRTVTISAGATTAANIANTYYLPPALWRIGNWDGTPREFLNGDKITDMHPSDVRMSPWAADAAGMTNFIVGTTPDSAWPMAEWKFQNTNVAGPFMDIVNRITFDLTAGQAATAMTVRIGITRLDHGRPAISVNGVGQSVPGLTTQPTARGLTLGSWRGTNTLYTWSLAASALHAGTNTIDITCASGSGTGGVWLSPWHIYDALDLVATSSITNAPVVNSIVVSPANPQVVTNSPKLFTAQAYDQFGNPTPANFTWSATRGVVDNTGSYIAPATSGADAVTAISGAINGNSNITVVPPLAISSANFEYQTAQALVLNFNRDVDPALLAGALALQNLTSETTVPPASIHLAYNSLSGRFTFDGILPDGDYRATIPATASLNSAGEKLATTYTFNFFVRAADANHDGAVNSMDFGVIAANFGQSISDFAQGDFNYDGVVNALDFGAFASRYGQPFAAPATAPPQYQGAAPQYQLSTPAVERNLFGSEPIGPAKLAEIS